jgi:hypothetical protein
MTLLRKDRLGVEQIESAIKDLKLEDGASGQPFLSYSSPKEKPAEPVQEPLFFSNKTAAIDKKIDELLNAKRKPEPQLLFDWVQIENRIPYTASNSLIKTLRGNQAKDSEMSLIQMKCRKKELQGILIKESEGTTMSKVGPSDAGVRRVPRAVLPDPQRAGRADRPGQEQARLQQVPEQ